MGKMFFFMIFHIFQNFYNEYIYYPDLPNPIKSRSLSISLCCPVEVCCFFEPGFLYMKIRIIKAPALYPCGEVSGGGTGKALGEIRHVGGAREL